ncbi:MAG: hypothetical protein H7338_22730 [Candidatus Sericytochromatia bacterium]|nr:hypothetical protein [Candidatus Sericytochromatia bacterium]
MMFRSSLSRPILILLGVLTAAAACTPTPPGSAVGDGVDKSNAPSGAKAASRPPKAGDNYEIVVSQGNSDRRTTKFEFVDLENPSFATKQTLPAAATESLVPLAVGDTFSSAEAAVTFKQRLDIVTKADLQTFMATEWRPYSTGNSSGESSKAKELKQLRKKHGLAPQKFYVRYKASGLSLKEFVALLDLVNRRAPSEKPATAAACFDFLDACDVDTAQFMTAFGGDLIRIGGFFDKMKAKSLKFSDMAARYVGPPDYFSSFSSGFTTKRDGLHGGRNFIAPQGTEIAIETPSATEIDQTADHRIPSPCRGQLGIYNFSQCETSISGINTCNASDTATQAPSLGDEKYTPGTAFASADMVEVKFTD